MRNQSTVDDDQQGGSTKRSDFLGCVKREDANNKLKIYSSCFVYNTSVHAYVQECYLVGCRMIIFRKEKKAEIYALQAESRPIPTIFSARECGAFETRRRVRPHQKDLGPGHHNMDHVSHCWGWKEGVGPMLVLSTFFGTTPMWHSTSTPSTQPHTIITATDRHRYYHRPEALQQFVNMSRVGARIGNLLSLQHGVHQRPFLVVVAPSLSPSSLSSAVIRRSFGTRKPRRSALRAQIASDRRIQRQLQKSDQNKKGGSHSVNDDQHGEQILSETGMKWGFFFTLGVAPCVAFIVAVATTPHLRQQFDDLMASLSGGQSTTAVVEKVDDETKTEEQQQSKTDF